MPDSLNKIILASASPRRRELLTRENFNFCVFPSNAKEESECDTDPRDLALANARLKAEEVSEKFPNCPVLGADTIVVLNGEVFGKPKDVPSALEMLRTLSGSTHNVVSGIAVRYQGKTVTSFEQTKVTFRKIDDDEIMSYIESGEPFDKAGGYGIQDKASVFVKKIDGDYFNVVGLPVFNFFSVLKNDFGLDGFSLFRR